MSNIRFPLGLPQLFPVIRSICLGEFPRLSLSKVALRTGFIGMGKDRVDLTPDISFEEFSHRMALCPIYSNEPYLGGDFGVARFPIHFVNDSEETMAVTSGMIFSSTPFEVPYKDILVVTLGPRRAISGTMQFEVSTMEEHAKNQVFYTPSYQEGTVTLGVDAGLSQETLGLISGKLREMILNSINSI